MSKNTKKDIKKRIELLKKFLMFVLRKPKILDNLPNEAEVVLLSEDLDFSGRNFELTLKGKDLKNLVIFK